MNRLAPTLVVALCAGSAGAQQLNIGNGEVRKDQLRAAYPKAMFLQEGTENGWVQGNASPKGPVRIVCGTRMTQGRSAVEAADTFLAMYDEVFAVEAPVLTLRSELVVNDREEWSVSKHVLRYNQSIDGIPVEGSDVRVLVVRDKNDPNAQFRVNFAEATLMPIPAGGTEPAISKAKALAAAQRAMPEFAHWNEEPTLQITPVRAGNAFEGSLLTYAFAASDGLDIMSVREVLVDAHTGGIVNVREIIPRFCNESHEHAGPDITGNITSNRTPDWWSDTRVAVNSNFATCEVYPVNYDQKEVRVEAINSSNVVVGTAYTDANGDYSLPNTGSGPFTVRASLAGENWDEYFTLNWSPTVQPCSVAPTPVVLSTGSVSSGQSGVDFEFYPDPSPTAWDIDKVAASNVHEGIRIVRDYWRDILGSNNETVLDAYFIVTQYYGNPCGGVYVYNGSPTGTFWNGTWICPDTISVGNSGNAFGNGPCPHSGQQSVAAHEYGHLVTKRLLEIDFIEGQRAFYEGYADATSCIVLNDADGSIQPTILYPHGFSICGQHIREPLVLNPIYPNCSNNRYISGQLLAALWIELRASNISLATVRSMFGTWSMIAVLPGIICDDGPYVDTSAAVNTFIEVLTADDDDANLANGTPHYDTICAIFYNRNIISTTYTCADNIAGSSLPDCDGNGILNVFDFVCYGNLFQSGDPKADINRDGVVNSNDYVDFRSLYLDR